MKPASPDGTGEGGRRPGSPKYRLREPLRPPAPAPGRTRGLGYPLERTP